MTREYIHQILIIITAILILLTLASNFLFTHNGHVTRKSMKVTYVGILLSAISGLLTNWLSYDPPPSTSKIFTDILVVSVGLVIFSVYWASKYFSLPFLEKTIESIQKYRQK
jgi:hypothetical protein